MRTMKTSRHVAGLLIDAMASDLRIPGTKKAA
jgi:hypothetical protein